jgi:hypothetical protein
MLIGVISDTHGLLRPEAVKALEGCGLILHAGDVGSLAVLAGLRRIAPLVAVRGNVDTEPWVGKMLPATQVAEAQKQSIYILHRIADLDLKPEAAGFAAVIYGHSHQPHIEWKNGVLYFNPGSAGPRRFSLPVTVGRIKLTRGKLAPEIVEIL